MEFCLSIFLVDYGNSPYGFEKPLWIYSLCFWSKPALLLATFRLRPLVLESYRYLGLLLISDTVAWLRMKKILVIYFIIWIIMKYCHIQSKIIGQKVHTWWIILKNAIFHHNGWNCMLNKISFLKIMQKSKKKIQKFF